MSALDVWENVEIPLLLHGESRPVIQQRCADVLETVHLTNRSRFSVGVLSGGERQRVAIARAIAADPPILLCDEPTASLDSKTGHQIISMLRNLADEQGKAVLIVTHDDRLLSYANRVYHMNDGQVREELLPTPAVTGLAE
jgi:putative ABC transport system ATP-binding protein